MHAPFANLFIALQNRISRNISAITYIDQDLGQLSAKSRPPVSWPCLLIDFEDFRFKDLSEHVQTAKGTVVLRLGFAPYSATAAATPLHYREQSLSYYDIEWDVNKALQGWSPDGDEFGSLMRISATTQPRTDGYRVRELRYKIAFDDYSAKVQHLTAPATLIITERFGL